MGMSPRVCISKKCVFSLARNVDSELMSFGSEFQTFGAAIQNARLAVSVRVHGTERRGASVDRRDRVVTWRCRSSEVDRALCVMLAIFSTGCTAGQAASEETLVAIWTHLCC